MTTTPKSKCCGADVNKETYSDNEIRFICNDCLQPCDLQDQPTSKLDEVSIRCSCSIVTMVNGTNKSYKAKDYYCPSHEAFQHLVKLAIQEYTSDLNQSLTKANEELVELRALKDQLVVVLPMAKGWAYLNDVGNNRQIVNKAYDLLEQYQFKFAIAAQEKMK